VCKARKGRGIGQVSNKKEGEKKRPLTRNERRQEKKKKPGKPLSVKKGKGSKK